jgi:hypothetical protein
MDDLEKLNQWLQLEHVESGLFAAEKGCHEEHLHFQGVVRVIGMTAAATNKSLKAALGWTNKGADYNVMCKTLSREQRYTFMLGYCIKDVGKPHFKCVLKNITDSQIERGRIEHLKHGAAELKGMKQLDPSNIMARALHFYLHSRTNYDSVPSIDHVLLAMLRSGHFYPSPKFIVPFQGMGMDYIRCTSLWRVMTEPGSTTLKDVSELFFYSQRRQLRYYHPQPGDTACEDHLRSAEGLTAKELTESPVLLHGIPPRLTPQSIGRQVTQDACTSEEPPTWLMPKTSLTVEDVLQNRIPDCSQPSQRLHNLVALATELADVEGDEADRILRITQRLGNSTHNVHFLETIESVLRNGMEQNSRIEIRPTEASLTGDFIDLTGTA